MANIFNIFKKKKNQNVCPYCQIEFEKEYARKFKCPNCQEEVFIKKYGDFKTYITKEESDVIKIEQQKQSEIDTFYDDFNGHYTKSQLDEIRNAYLKKFGKMGNMKDLTWKLYTQLNSDYAKANNFQEMSKVFNSLARIAYDEGRDGFKLSQQSKKWELMYYQSVDILKGVQINAAKDACDICKASNDRILTIKDALKEMPLPHSDCSNKNYGFCRCMYLGVTETDEEMDARWAREK